MKKFVLTLLAVLTGVANADYELRYFSGKEDALVEYATVYLEYVQGNADVVFAWCGDTDSTCNRSHVTRKLVKRVPYGDYVTQQAKSMKVTLKYVQEPKTGLARLDRDLKAAKEANQYSVVRELERQREAVNFLNTLMKPLAVETAGSLNQNDSSFRKLLMPFLSAAEVGADPNTAPLKVLDLSTFTDWVLVEKTPTRFRDAKALCEKAGGTLPSMDSYHSVDAAFEASAGSSWVPTFWLDGASFQSKYEQVKEPYGNGYILKTVRIGSVSVPHVVFADRKGTVTVGNEQLYVQDSSATARPLAEEQAMAIERMAATHAVVCRVPRTAK